MTVDRPEVVVAGAVAVVVLEGDVDTQRTQQLREPLMRAAEEHVVALLLDLSAVTYLDSAGVHLVLDLHRELTRRGFAFHLVRPVRHTPALVLEVTGVGGAIPVHPDRAAALAVMDPPDDDDE